MDLRRESASAGIGRGEEKGQMQIIDDVGVCLWSVVFVFTFELLFVWWVAMSDERRSTQALKHLCMYISSM